MDWSVWVMFAITEGALILVPGPAVLFVVSQGLRRGSAGAIGSAAGILAANALYFMLSGTGVGALLSASGDLFTLVKWGGAGYLLYRGVAALLRPPALVGAGEAAAATGGRLRAVVMRGLVLQLSNPKALLFFVAILPQFVDRGRPIVPQMVILGVTSIVLEFLVLAAYGAAAAGAAQAVIPPRFATAASRVSGALLVGAALGLARVKG